VPTEQLAVELQHSGRPSSPRLQANASLDAHGALATGGGLSMLRSQSYFSFQRELFRRQR
jgi:hypothetical protein